MNEKKRTLTEHTVRKITPGKNVLKKYSGKEHFCSSNSFSIKEVII